VCVYGHLDAHERLQHHRAGLIRRLPRGAESASALTSSEFDQQFDQPPAPAAGARFLAHVGRCLDAGGLPLGPFPDQHAGQSASTFDQYLTSIFDQYF
jgi:hypothetical protein